MPKKTFECAEEAGAILITQVKDNQRSLKEQIIHGCNISTSISIFTEDVTKEHGRIEQRIYEVFEAKPILSNFTKDWPYIRAVIKVTRYREELNKSKPSITVSYYVSNRELKPGEYAKYIREHWFIENKLHCIKDTTFKEDRTVKRVNPYIYSTCIDIALNIMRSIKAANIRSTVYKNALDFNMMYASIQSLL